MDVSRDTGESPGTQKHTPRQAKVKFTETPQWPGFPGSSDSKESACKCWRPGFDSWVGKKPWWREWQPTPVFFPGESHGQKSPAGYSPQSCRESDATSTFTFRFHALYSTAMKRPASAALTEVHLLRKGRQLRDKYIGLIFLDKGL